MLGHPESVVAVAVHGLGNGHRLVEHGGQVVVLKEAVIDRGAGVADILHVHVSGEETVKLGNHLSYPLTRFPVSRFPVSKFPGCKLYSSRCRFCVNPMAHRRGCVKAWEPTTDEVTQRLSGREAQSPFHHWEKGWG